MPINFEKSIFFYDFCFGTTTSKKILENFHCRNRYTSIRCEWSFGPFNIMYERCLKVETSRPCICNKKSLCMYAQNIWKSLPIFCPLLTLCAVSLSWFQMTILEWIFQRSSMYYNVFFKKNIIFSLQRAIDRKKIAR